MLLYLDLIPLIILALIFFVLWDYGNKKRRNRILEKCHITGPDMIPLLGNALFYRGINMENIVKFAIEKRNLFGRVYRIWVLNQLAVFISDAKYIEYILSSQKLIQKSKLYNLLEPWLGNGLLLSNGKKWHTRRKIITPTFHFTILEQFLEIFEHQSAVMVHKLYAKADGKTTINIFPIICLMALDIITETAMGVKVHAQEQPDIEYVRALSKLANIINQRFINPVQRIDWCFRLTRPKQYWTVRRCIKIMHDFTNEVIQRRRETLQRSIADGTFQQQANDNAALGSKKRMALLDVLLQSTVDGSPLSNEDIREEVDTFMFEGHDTTTSGISYCLYLISRHPEIQQKLIDEIHAIIGKHKDRPVRYKDLQELKYLDCVIKESLRLYPPVPLIARQTTEDMVLGDITIPANTSVNLQLFVTLRDPAYFSEPDAFKPERFSLESDSKINTFAYTPFSAGPRNCIGKKFAMLEMKSTISKMLRHFELLPLGEPIHPTINLILRSITGVNVGLKLRE